MSQQSHESLVASLGPVLRDACGGRLSEVEWFRPTWRRRAGAETGFATFEHESSQEPTPVLVKTPIKPGELRWTAAASGYRVNGRAVVAQQFDASGGPTPRVFAGGYALGPYDMTWIVEERLNPGPPIQEWKGDDFLGVFQAVAEWYAIAASADPLESSPPDKPWDEWIDRAIEITLDSPFHQASQWTAALKRVRTALQRMLITWDVRPCIVWRHGDLHPGNAMRRVPASGKPRWVIIDLGLVTPGHWVEDALYFEHLFWGREELLQGVNPVSTLAERCQAHGIEVGDEYAELADIKRILTASVAPCQPDRTGDTIFLESALVTIERLIGKFGA